MILTSDLLWHLSTTAGTAGNTTASTPNASLGKYLSTTLLVDSLLSNLFDTITGAENAALEAEYRLMFVHNNHATLTLLGAIAWLETEIAGGAVAAISVDTTGITAVGSIPVQAKTIANEDTAPATQVFTAPTTKATGLSIGNLAPGQCQGIWVRRTTTNSPPFSLDGVGVRVEGDTAQ